MNKEFYKKIAKVIFIDIIWEIIYFPIWWYSHGFINVFQFFCKTIKQNWKNRGLSIGFRFLFKPMYSQNDFAGRAISFFMRLIILIFKIIFFMILFFIYLTLLMLWVLLPIIVIREIFINYKFII